MIPFPASAARFGAALACLICSGCVSVAPVTFPPDRPTVRLNVPYLPQDDFQCGPAAVAMVLAALGQPVPLEQLRAEIYSPSRHGSLQPALVAAGRRHGLLAWEIDDFDAILAEVAAGRPVIILQNRGLTWKPLWHYALVVGFDAAQGTILLTSGIEHERQVALRTVQATWERGGHWGLLLLPPGALPLQAEPGQVLTALVGLERSQATAARQGYDAAVTRWPIHAGLATARGNLLRKLGEAEAAEAAYRAALRAEPQHVPALNNLADLLLARGRLDEARAAATAAAAQESPYRASAEATLQAIETAQGSPPAIP